MSSYVESVRLNIAGQGLVLELGVHQQQGLKTSNIGGGGRSAITGGQHSEIGGRGRSAGGGGNEFIQAWNEEEEENYQNLPPPLPSSLPPSSLPPPPPSSSFPPPPPPSDLANLSGMFQGLGVERGGQGTGSAASGTFHAKPYSPSFPGSNLSSGPGSYLESNLDDPLHRFNGSTRAPLGPPGSMVGPSGFHNEQNQSRNPGVLPGAYRGKPVGSTGSSIASSTPSPPQTSPGAIQRPSKTQGPKQSSEGSILGFNPEGSLQRMHGTIGSQTKPGSSSYSTQTHVGPTPYALDSSSRSTYPSNSPAHPYNSSTYPSNVSPHSTGHGYPHQLSPNTSFSQTDDSFGSQTPDNSTFMSDFKGSSGGSSFQGLDPSLEYSKVSKPTRGAENQPPTESKVGWYCSGCGLSMNPGEVAVFAERAGRDKCWHPACFSCSSCGELLQDLLYFYSKGKLFCGRDFATVLDIPRCSACDELIFAAEYTGAEDRFWHLKHFCCYECDTALAGHKYIPVNSQPHCLTCWQNKHGKICSSCESYISPEDKRVTLGDTHWHATEDCFKCAVCSSSLLGGKMTRKEGVLLCSSLCANKLVQQGRSALSEVNKSGSRENGLIISENREQSLIRSDDRNISSVEKLRANKIRNPWALPDTPAVPQPLPATPHKQNNPNNNNNNNNNLPKQKLGSSGPTRQQFSPVPPYRANIHGHVQSSGHLQNPGHVQSSGHLQNPGHVQSSGHLQNPGHVQSSSQLHNPSHLQFSPNKKPSLEPWKPLLHNKHDQTHKIDRSSGSYLDRGHVAPHGLRSQPDRGHFESSAPARSPRHVQFAADMSVNSGYSQEQTGRRHLDESFGDERRHLSSSDEYGSNYSSSSPQHSREGSYSTIV